MSKKTEGAKEYGSGAKKRIDKPNPWVFPLNKTNLIIIGLGVVVIALGYLLMHYSGKSEWNSPMAVTVAPMLLLAGYCVIIPYGIMKIFKSRGEDQKES